MCQEAYSQDDWSTKAQAGGRSSHNGQTEYTVQNTNSFQNTQSWYPENLTLRVADSSSNEAAAQQYYAQRAANNITSFGHSFNQRGN